MKDRIETFTSRIFINDQQAKNRIKELTQYMENLRKEKEKAASAGDWESFNRLKKELDKTNKELRSMQSSAQKVDNVLRTLDQRSVKEIKQTIASINREMNSGAIERGSDQWRFLNEQLVRCKQELKAIAEESKIASDITESSESRLMGFLGKFNQIGFAITNLFGMGTGFTGLIAKVRDLTAESVNLAQSAEGVEAAFERINKPGLLDELKKATHGTVSELELMKQAVKFKDFNLPVEQLGLYLSFAQQKAKDTGESIDYLVNSIVTGLGRQSPMILDNLGLSAKQISEEAKKSGDFFGAVAKIVKERMGEAGEYMETSMDRAAKATADLQNAQRELGAVLLPLKENADTLFKELQTGLLHTIKFLVQHREAVMTLVGGYVGLKAVVALYVAITEKQLLLELANAAAKVKTAVATKASAAATAIATVAQKAWTTAVLLANAAATLFTRGLGAMRVQMALARMEGMALTASGFGALAAVITVVGVAAVGLYNILKKQNTALQEMSRHQRLVNQAEKEARMDASRQTAELNRLYEASQDTNRSMEERLSCVNKLKQQYPGYFGQLSNEAILAGQAAAQYRQLTEDIIKASKARAYQEKIEKLSQENIEHEEAVQENKNWNTANTDKVAHAKMNEEKLQRTISPVVPGSTNLFGSDDNRRNLNSADTKILEEYEQRQKVTQDHLKKIEENNQTIQKMADEVIKNQPALDRINGTTPAATTPTGGGGGSDTTDEYTTKADQMKVALDRQLLELKRNYQEKMITEEQYHDESYKAEMAYLVKLQTLQQQYKQPTTDTENKVLDNLLAEENYQRTQKQKEMNDELKMLDLKYKQQQTDTNKQYADGEIRNEEAYNQQRKQAEIDYQEQKLAIIKKYGGDTTDIENQISQRQVNDLKEDKAQMLKAFEERLQDADNDTSRFAILEQMRQQDLISEEQYQQRRVEITEDAEQRRMEIIDMAAQAIGSTLSSVSQLFNSLQQSEINKVQKRYDKQIEAARKAGKNTTKLEKQKEKEMAKIRKKYADAEFQVKVLEIMANTAVGITKTWATVGFPLAIPLTALMAAQGIMQIAVAKQAQQQASQVGYYGGGFTGGKRYRKEAGVVHEGEFVANHQAVNNPAVRPMLDFIDKAQRNNTVGSLTADDISRQLGQGGSAVVAPIVNVQTDNEELRGELQRSREVNEHLLTVIEEKGIKVDFPLDTFDREYRHFQKISRR